MALALARRAVLAELAQRVAPHGWKLPSSFPQLKQVRDEIRKAHLLVEVRDARVPFSSANLEFQRFLKWKSHIVVFNKADLVSPVALDVTQICFPLTSLFSHSGVRFFFLFFKDWKRFFGEGHYHFVNGHGKASVYRLMKVVKAKLLEAGDPLEKIKCVMLVGLPNVGKTTLANTMHLLGRANISPLEILTLGEIDIEPYTTKDIRHVKINYTPPMYAIDTPPVMVHRIHDLETGLKLALTGAIEDGVVGPIALAKLVLAMLNDPAAKEVHKRWKAQYQAHVFLSKARCMEVKRDRRLLGSDDHAADIRGLISLRFLEFEGNVEDADEMEQLVDAQLQDVRAHYQRFAVRSKHVTELRTAQRLLSLFRVGKLGSHSLDELPGTLANYP